MTGSISRVFDNDFALNNGHGNDFEQPAAFTHQPVLRLNMNSWIADRTASFDSSGIRKVFDLAAKMKNPINLSIGLPDFDVPDEIKQACVEAIHSGKNAYSQTQGIAPLRERLASDIAAAYPSTERGLLITSGTSGGLVLAMLAMVNPGDEVIYFDPYFVMYPALVKLAGGVPVAINSYPDFRMSAERVAAAITPKTKMILINSPANPSGVTAHEDDLRAIAKLAADKGIALVSDEIYSHFQYDTPFVSPAKFNDQTLVIDGFSKSHAMTGWRVGFVHGPPDVVAAMTKLQQFTFVCAPQPAQWAALRALDVDLSHHIDDYRHKRDMIVEGLRGLYDLTTPGGAFYAFPKVPESAGVANGTEFVERAIANELLVIPGKIFSAQDTHFRISYAASDETLKRGIEVLRRLANA
jgi:aspartate/methionine/tyrosine aminotransferase